MKPFEKLARVIRETSRMLTSPPTTVENARTRALKGWNARHRKTRTSRYVTVAGAFAAVAISIAAFVLPHHSAITYVIGTSATNGVVGAWIAAGSEGTELHFSEGTRLTLLRETRARVARADENGARVVLEQGSLHANVMHASPSTSWDVGAGPFEIHVVGTAFDVTWDPGREAFVLIMREGRVRVQGPLLGEGRTLERGEELHVEVAQRRCETRQTLDETPVPTAPRDEPTVVEDKDSPEIPDEPTMETPSKTAATATIPSWRQLALKGKHEEAILALEREGWNDVLARASVDVLFEIANEARFAKQYRRAEEALLQARSKGATGRSAFLLGKLAMDHRDARQDAITWFKTYLAEVPSGGLAEQAFERLLELQQDIKDSDGARQTAEQYLLRFPNGSHATLARTMVKP